MLRLFGASIASDAIIHPSVKIWAPWNLTMYNHATLAPSVECYCADKIVLKEYVIESQYTYLCTATHNFEKQGRPLVTKPIIIAAGAWVCAGVFIGPGVTIGEGAVIGARAVVVKDIEPWNIVAGNPAVFIRISQKLGQK